MPISTCGNRRFGAADGDMEILNRAPAGWRLVVANKSDLPLTAAVPDGALSAATGAGSINSAKLYCMPSAMPPKPSTSSRSSHPSGRSNC